MSAGSRERRVGLAWSTLRGLRHGRVDYDAKRVRAAAIGCRFGAPPNDNIVKRAAPSKEAARNDRNRVQRTTNLDEAMSRIKTTITGQKCTRNGSQPSRHPWQRERACATSS